MSIWWVILWSVLLLICASIFSCLFRLTVGKKPCKGFIYNKNTPPHENYPEILEWEEGDIFKIDRESWKKWYRRCKIKHIFEDGAIVIATGKEFSELEKWHIKHFMRLWWNIHIKDRREEKKQAGILEKINNDTGYYEFLKDMKRAYEEIKYGYNRRLVAFNNEVGSKS
jgi:hypothetical protein